MKLGRNDVCWCGSDVKHKNCHTAFDQKIMRYRMAGHMVPDHEITKTPAQITGTRKAGAVNAEILNRVDSIIEVGIGMEEVNKFVHWNTLELGGIPAPLNYDGFPKSMCTLVNDIVCHGTPSAECILKDGGIINMDVTTIVDGYHGDVSRMYCIGSVSDEARKLVEVTKKCTDLRLQEVRPQEHLGNTDAVISECACQNGFTAVREIGGHGAGVQPREELWVSYIGTRGTGMLLVPGMIFTIESMVNTGGKKVFQDEEDGWIICTEDGNLTTWWEYTVFVTEDGAEVLSR